MNHRRGREKRSAFITKILVSLNVLVFAYELYLQYVGGNAIELFFSRYALVPQQIFAGENLSSFATHMFIHGNIYHLIFNCIPMYFFGSYLERDIGSPRFAGIFFLSGVIGGLAYLVTDGMRSPNAPVLGASAAVFGVVGTVTLLHPLKFAWALLFPLPIVIFSALYVFVASALVTGGYIGNIAHSAHLGGMASGMILAFKIRPARALLGFIAFVCILAVILFLFLRVIG